MTRILTLITTLLVGFIAFETYTPPSFLLERWQANTPAVTWTDGEDAGGLGTGWVYDLDAGIIITNHHVIEGAKDQTSIEVLFPNSSTLLKAIVIGSAPNLDIAVLRVDPRMLKAIPGVSELGVSTADLGDVVYAVGHPHGQFGTVTKGVVSYKQRVSLTSPRQILVQTDTAINSGNSGGPLLNRWGQLIGVNVSILSKSGENNGIGFAVHPISLYKAIEEIERFGKTTRPLMGLNFDENGNILVSKEGAADKAGLRNFDIITHLDNTRVTGTNDILVFLAGKSVGDVVTVTTNRGKFEVTLEAEVEPVPTKKELLTDEEVEMFKEVLAMMIGGDAGIGTIKSIDVQKDGVTMVITVTMPYTQFEEHAKSGVCLPPLDMVVARVGVTVIYEDKDGKEIKKVELFEDSCKTKS